MGIEGEIMIICICDDSKVQDDFEIISNIFSNIGENTVIDITENDGWRNLITNCNLLFVINRYQLHKNTFEKIKFAKNHGISVEYMCNGGKRYA